MNCLHTVHAQTVLIKDVVYLLYIKYKFCIFYVVLQSLLSMRVKNNQKYIEHKPNVFFLEKIFFLHYVFSSARCFFLFGSLNTSKNNNTRSYPMALQQLLGIQIRFQKRLESYVFQVYHSYKFLSFFVMLSRRQIFAQFKYRFLHYIDIVEIVEW